MSKHDEYVVQIDRILSKLELARSRQLTCYGSDNHGFRLNAPLVEAEIHAFESREQIRLPEDYRMFLTHAGNGGAGPYNGIFPLDEWDDFAGWVVDKRQDHFLALPCPLHQGLSRTKDWDKDFGDASPYQGTLSLGSQGCTYAMQLIVSGPCRGQVVYVEANDSPPHMVHEPDFLSWYERWLDELLQGYNSSWFGFGPGGGEEDFFRILSDPQAKDDFKAEAAFAFRRLPHLSDEAAPRVAEYLDHPDAGVRNGALATIRHFQLGGFINQVNQRLEDPSADVREQAVYTAMKLEPQRSAKAVASLLREDPSEDVVRAAFYTLRDAEALSKVELLRLLEDPTRLSLRALVAHAIGWGAEDESLLIRLLADSNSQVRSHAMLSLKQTKGKASLPQLLDLLTHEQDVNIVAFILRAFGEFGDAFTVPILLEWVKSADDFHHLEAMEALAKIGDERAMKSAQAMLQEQRVPVQKDARGGTSRTHTRTISDLVRQSLLASPNQTLRQLGG